MAITRGDIATVRLLLAFGADPNLPGTPEGASPLAFASKYGMKEIVECLVHSRASGK
jgi:ankyrin repeat protein